MTDTGTITRLSERFIKLGEDIEREKGRICRANAVQARRANLERMNHDRD